MKKLVIIFFGAAFFLSCSKSGTTEKKCPYTESTTTASAGEIAYIQNYLSTNGITTATQHSSGIFYEITAAGSGNTPALCSYCSVKYTGRLFNGTIFDQNLFGTTFTLGDLIVGWQKGLPLIKPNGTIRLYVPPSLGYGTAGSGSSVPPNAYLIFDIQLTAVAYQ